jgi:hypothetical protein
MMTAQPLMTVGQLARDTGRPTWLIRRIVDRLGAVTARVGQYRIVDASRLAEVVEAIENAPQPSTKKGSPAATAE